MKHFDIAEWADFVRGLTVPGRHDAMSRHLESGCGSCGRIAEMLGKVAPLAAAEARYEVPEFAVHCARAIYALEQPQQVRIFPRLLGRLVFDSFREPLPAGVRSQQRICRQTVFEAGRYAVDLRQEQDRGCSRVTVVGQIADRDDPARELTGVPVVLSSGRSVLARAVSNRFGEFQMDYMPARNLRLDVGVPQPVNRRRRSRKRTEDQGGLE